jgi:hypothetical protein
MLPSSNASSSCSALQAALQDRTTTAHTDESNSSSVLEDMSAWAADCVEGLGFAVVRLGRWMRGKLSGQQEDGQQEAASSGQTAKGASGDRAHMLRVGGGTLAAVTVAMVAIISVVLLKKPVKLSRLVQMLRKAA